MRSLSKTERAKDFIFSKINKFDIFINIKYLSYIWKIKRYITHSKHMELKLQINRFIVIIIRFRRIKPVIQVYRVIQNLAIEGFKICGIFNKSTFIGFLSVLFY